MKKLTGILPVLLTVFLLSLFFTNNAFAAINLDVAAKDKNKIGSVIKTSWTSSGIDVNKTLDLYLTSAKTGIGYFIKSDLPLNGSYDWVIPNTTASAKDYQLSLSTNDKGPSDGSEYSTPFEIKGSKEVPIFTKVSSKVGYDKLNKHKGIIFLTYTTQGNIQNVKMKMNISCPEGVTVSSKKGITCDTWVDLGKNNSETLAISYENKINTEQTIGFTFDMTNSSGVDVQRVFELVKVPGSNVLPPDSNNFVQLINKTIIGTNGDAFLDFSIKGDKNNTKVSYWDFEYQCLKGVVFDSGKSILCDGMETGKKVQQLFAYNMYATLKDYKLWTVGAQNENSTSQKLVFNLKAFDSKGKLLGSDIETVVLSAYKNVNAPVVSYVQAKAADKNEIFSEEEPILYGQNLSKQTQVYLLLNNGEKKFFDGGTLANSLKSMTFITPKRGTIPNGTYKLLAENGAEMSNAITITYKNQTVDGQPSIQVLSPNGGETFAADSGIIKIKGQVTGVQDGTTVIAYLYHPEYGNVRSAGGVTIDGRVSIEMNLEKGGGHNPGQYKITMCANGLASITGKDLCDSSDKYFQLNSSGPIGICTFTRDLTVGSSGDDVANLQYFLQQRGFLGTSGEDKGYFGAATKAALAKYQVSVGISPADGYFGAMTRASAVANCGTVVEPYIKILSPNGGENYTAGDNIVINWETNLPKEQNLQFALMFANKGMGKEIATVKAGDKSYVWKSEYIDSIISTEVTPPQTIYSNGSFKAWLYCPHTDAICVRKDGTESNYVDESDNVFTIQKVATSTQIRQPRPRVVPPATPSANTSMTSTVDLEIGMAHPSVRTLQKYLNSNGYMIETKEGQSGSNGYETDYFGEKTKQALIKYQTDKGISPAQGYFGAKTRFVMGI